MCVVLFLTEGAKWLSADEKRLAAFRAHAKRGGGLVVLHWGMGTQEAEPIEAFVDLFGGCHGGPDRKYKVAGDERRGRRREAPDRDRHQGLHGSRRVLLQAQVPEGRRTAVKPVLTPRSTASKEMVAWSWERPDGGRSFGFSGLHFHDNWKREEYRRLVAQGVLWTAKLPIPEKGLAVDLPESALRAGEEVSPAGSDHDLARSIAAMRQEYSAGGLSEAEAGDDPFALFRLWFEQASRPAFTSRTPSSSPPHARRHAVGAARAA